MGCVDNCCSGFLRFYVQWEGTVLSFTAALMLAINLIIIKTLEEVYIPPFQLLFTRYFVPLVLVGIITIVQNTYIWYQETYKGLKAKKVEDAGITDLDAEEDGEKGGLFEERLNYFYDNHYEFVTLTIRALLHWVSNLFLIWSLLFIDVVLNVSVWYSWPIFGMVISYYMLDEKVTWVSLVAAVGGFFGVLLLTNPTLSAFNALGAGYMEGVVFCLVSAVLYAFQFAVLRKRRAGYHWIHSESMAGLWGAVILCPIAFLLLRYIPWFNMTWFQVFRIRGISGYDWAIFVFCGVFSFGAIGGTARALQVETMTRVSIILYSEIVFGTLGQLIFLGDTTNFDTAGLWIGMFLVVGSSFLILWDKKKVKEASPAHKPLKVEDAPNYEAIESGV